MPACYDALGAKLIARSGAFECAFMSGYGVSASRLGDPDVGLASLADVVDAGAHVCRAAGDVPIVGDGDTDSAASPTFDARSNPSIARGSPPSP